MLNSASDYEFVDVSDVGGFIHGDVLPVRFSALSSAGRYATCNYEDYLYLLEAYYERMNYDQDGQNNITPANRTLSSSYVRSLHWPNTVGVFPGIGQSLYINPQSTLPSSLTELTSSQTIQVVQNYQMSLSSNVSTYRYKPYQVSPRELELWGRFFYDYHRLNRLVCNKNILTDICTENPVGSGTYRYYMSDGTPRDRATSYTTYTGSDNFYVYRHTNVTTGYGSEEVVSFTWPLKQTIQHAPHAASAILITRFHLVATDSNIDKYYCYPLQLNISNGNISLPNTNWINSMVQTILSLNNLPYITSFQGQHQGVQENTSIFMGDCYLIADFDFPADYTSWNWEPNYTSS